MAERQLERTIREPLGDLAVQAYAGPPQASVTTSISPCMFSSMTGAEPYNDADQALMTASLAAQRAAR